jgi:hypothetical protein
MAVRASDITLQNLGPKTLLRYAKMYQCRYRGKFLIRVPMIKVQDKWICFATVYAGVL